MTLVRLQAFVTWFKGAFPVASDFGDLAKFPALPEPMSVWLLKAMENYVCVSPVQRVLIFILAARSMGWPTRLVLNFNPVSMKPEKDKSLSTKLSDIMKDKKTKEETKDQDEPSAKVKKEHQSTSREVDNKSQKKSRSSRSKSSAKEESKSAKSKKQDDDKSKSNSRSRASRSATASSKEKEAPSASSSKSRSSSRIQQSKSSSSSKRKSESPIKKSPEKKSRLSEAALKEASLRSTSKSSSPYFRKKLNSASEDSEDDFAPDKDYKINTPKKKKTSSPPKSSKSPKASLKQHPYWAEVYVTKSGWVTVDVDKCRVDCAAEMEERVGIKPLLYIIAANADGSLKDVTRYIVKCFVVTSVFF